LARVKTVASEPSVTRIPNGSCERSLLRRRLSYNRSVDAFPVVYPETVAWRTSSFGAAASSPKKNDCEQIVIARLVSGKRWLAFRTHDLDENKSQRVFKKRYVFFFYLFVVFIEGVRKNSPLVVFKRFDELSRWNVFIAIKNNSNSERVKNDDWHLISARARDTINDVSHNVSTLFIVFVNRNRRLPRSNPKASVWVSRLNKTPAGADWQSG